MNYQRQCEIVRDELERGGVLPHVGEAMPCCVRAAKRLAEEFVKEQKNGKGTG